MTTPLTRRRSAPAHTTRARRSRPIRTPATCPTRSRASRSATPSRSTTAPPTPSGARSARTCAAAASASRARPASFDAGDACGGRVGECRLRISVGQQGMPMAHASLTELGPVDYVVVEFPAGASSFTGEMAEELLALVDAGTIRVIDIVILTKDEDGSIEAM